MPIRKAIYLLALLLCVSGWVSTAGELPSFPADKAIRKGTLPNGADYYLVANKETVGYADFALVQKGYARKHESRRRLVKLQDFGTVKPYKYLASKGVGYGGNGFVTVQDGSTVFNFRNVPVYDGAAPDSTLLLLFNIMRETEAEQAVIVSGDIDVQKVSDRIYALSMTVPKLDAASQAEEYVWTPQKFTGIRTLNNHSGKLASISVAFRSPRTPDTMMDTPQPLVTGMFCEELGAILSGRISAAFHSSGIPLARCEFSRIDSGRTSGDEKCSFAVYTERDSVYSATRVLGKVFGDLCAHGAGVVEFTSARDNILWTISNRSSVMTNAEYVDKCIRSYLFKASLAPGSAARKFFADHKLPGDKESELFNAFAAALMPSPSSAVLTYGIQDRELDTDALVASFARNWDESAADSLSHFKYGYSYADTLRLKQPKGRVKLKTSSPDPVTGGSVWTFSNGMKVVYRKSTECQGLEYSFMIRGGYGSVPDIRPGENAFVGDMLSLYDVAGMSAGNFASLLSSNGISMHNTVSAADLRIYGSAPSSKLQLLLKSLLALSSDRAVNKEAFASYCRDESLRIEAARYSDRELFALRDSLMCPSYKFSEVRRMENLRKDLPERAEKYYAGQFSKASDGIFVIVGNLDEQYLQKILSQYLSGFRTSRTSAARPKIPYGLRGGWITYSVDSDISKSGPGSDCGISSFSASLPFNMDTFMAFRIAAVAAEKAAVRALSDYGMYVSVSRDVSIFPTDRFSLTVDFRPCATRGLPAGIRPSSPAAALSSVRKEMMKLVSGGIAESELKACKTELKARLAKELTTPSSLCEAAVTRYSLGRDLISRYSEYVDAVSLQSVRDVLVSLDKGTRVEIISR